MRAGRDRVEGGLAKVEVEVGRMGVRGCAVAVFFLLMVMGGWEAGEESGGEVVSFFLDGVGPSLWVPFNPTTVSVSCLSGLS